MGLFRKEELTAVPSFSAKSGLHVHILGSARSGCGFVDLLEILKQILNKKGSDCHGSVVLIDVGSDRSELWICWES